MARWHVSREADDLARQAMKYQQGDGWSHGDLLLDALGKPHVADFGVARLIEKKSTLTHTHAVLGTPGYIAPGQPRNVEEPPVGVGE